MLAAYGSRDEQVGSELGFAATAAALAVSAGVDVTLRRVSTAERGPGPSEASDREQPELVGGV